MNDQHLRDLFEKSIEALKTTNSTSYGLLAAAAHSLEGKRKNYTSLFSRDIGISTLGMLASKDEQLLQVTKTSLISLSHAQSNKGQFPFYYKPEEQQIEYWTPGSIDSTLWWCIAFLSYTKATHDRTFYEEYKHCLEKGFTWLSYQDTNNDALLEQGEASDWADEMPRHGSVLYTNTLWYWLVKLRIEVEEKQELTPLLHSVHTAFNTVFWILKSSSSNTSYIPENEYVKKNKFAKGILEYTNAHAQYLPYYLGYVAHKSFEMRCDVFGNILACLVGLADEEKTTLIIDFVFRSGSNTPYPVKALYPPIYPGENDWKEYMAKGRQNYPWQYHNGGIWPFIGGFWVLLLAQQQHPEMHHELEKLAKANALNNNEFNEYLHGQMGTPMGITHQSWNMAMYIAAYKAVVEGFNLSLLH